MKLNAHRLTELFGNEETAQRFAQLFTAQLPQQMEAMRSAARLQDWNSVSTHAHSLKSQCRYVGLDDVAEMLQRLEDHPETEVGNGLLSNILHALTTL